MTAAGAARRHPLDLALTEALAALPPSGKGAAPDRGQPVRPGSALTAPDLLALFDDMLLSRRLDLAARSLREEGQGFYTIGSSGHEGNALLALATRPSDPALVHYRSGAFYTARSRQVPGIDPVRDVLLGMFASSDEPIAGGRHKVFGRYELAVIPKTATIASHLPRALGIAWAIGRGDASAWPSDAVMVCTFGDASANHSTAAGAINAAAHFAYRNRPLPLLFVCEDNGIGISVPTPDGWIASAYGNRSGLRYDYADTTAPLDAYDVIEDVVDHVRTQRRPAFLHLRTVRFLGHAGTDVEAGYRTAEEIRRDYAHDPILALGREIVALGIATADELVARHDAARERVEETARSLTGSPTLTTAVDVMAPLSPRRPAIVEATVERFAAPEPPSDPLTLALAINRALTDVLHGDHRTIVFGEDVGVKGGVYGVTRGLQKRFGPDRVFDTLLDEQTILGLALGSALSGLVPVPEIQYLAYLHNAEDQLRGEAASQSFFSKGQYRNGMVVRIAGYGYQKGFGGHFHNDDAVGVLRDIPGLVIASPSRPSDAAAMLRTCVAAAATDGTVCVFLEPIALYHTSDLHEPGDGQWLEAVAPASAPDAHVPIGSARVHGRGDDLLIVTWGNGLHLSLRAARRLAASAIDVRVLDVRWLAPLPIDEIVAHAEACGRVLVVDETRHSGGAGEGIVTGLVERGFGGQIARVASKDSYVPLGDAAMLVLVGLEEIEAAARALMSDGRPGAGPANGAHRGAVPGRTVVTGG